MASGHNVLYIYDFHSNNMDKGFLLLDGVYQALYFSYFVEYNYFVMAPHTQDPREGFRH